MSGRKIAIVGTCPSSRDLALRLDDSWEMWVCAPDNMAFPRIDLWFELHGDLDYPGEKGQWGYYIAWLNGQGFPVFAQDQHLIPRAMIFPAKKLVEEFGDFFFSSQPAWMIAYAIQQGASEIALFGLDMAAQSEYARQKPDALHFIWLARQRGIKVLAPPESEIMAPPPLYGYSTNSPMGRKLTVRRRELQTRRDQMIAERNDLDARITFFNGAIDENDWTEQTWTGGLFEETGEVVRVAQRPRVVAAE